MKQGTAERNRSPRVDRVSRNELKPAAATE